ncbi:MAG: MBL fold metallo-hydrolase [Burkholderiales bacterium]|nr:MBL fold metallo-hydrolase [Burkholderiales bacterium]
MKKIRLALSFLMMLATFCHRASADTAITLTPKKVSAHVYYFQGESGVASAANQGFMSNAGFVVTPDGVVVFDALATPALGEAMIKAIKAVTTQPIKKVIAGHYHADHIYGLQAFKQLGADIIAHEAGQSYLHSDLAQQRLEQRRTELFPWVDEHTVVTGADHWLNFSKEKIHRFSLGGIRFQIIDSSGAHSAEDILLFVENDRVLFAGDIYFSGRIPFVGNADSRVWLATLDRLLDVKPTIVIPGHGAASTQTEKDMQLTKSYLEYLRQQMGMAVNDLLGFEEAYQRTDWSRFENLPAFKEANRLNAYGTYLLMEKESLAK